MPNARRYREGVFAWALLFVWLWRVASLLPTSVPSTGCGSPEAPPSGHPPTPPHTPTPPRQDPPTLPPLPQAWSPRQARSHFKLSYRHFHGSNPQALSPPGHFCL